MNGNGSNGIHVSSDQTARLGEAPPIPSQPAHPLTESGRVGAAEGHASDINNGVPLPTATSEQAERETDLGGGVHAITKNTDYWFEREIGVIERDAREDAAQWAQRGLPRHDVARTEPLEPEQVLIARCAQLFRDWQRRVRTKMQDAIEDGSQEVGAHVSELRNSVTRLEAIRSENEDLRSRLTRLRVEAEQEKGRPVRYTRYIPSWLFWPGALILALVEFFANFPVFRLMLPMSSALNAAAQSAADNVDDTSLMAGPSLLGHEMLMHVEATIVALVAVVILVALGKTLGSSMRPLLAFKAADFPLADQTIRAHQRQKGALLITSGFGIILVLSFLFVSRGRIADMASNRVSADSVRVEKLKQEGADLSDRTKAAQATLRLLDAENAHRQYEDDAAYAKTVAQNNVPILFLNIGLILTALVLGFSYAADDLTDKRGEHPEIISTQDRLSQLDREMFHIVQQGSDSTSKAHGAIARVQHLLRANPLREWSAKLDRLQGVIPLFRGENARSRGLDPANIRAFDAPAHLDLPPIDHDETFLEPADFSRLKKEFAELAGAFTLMVPRMTPAYGHRVVS